MHLPSFPLPGFPLCSSISIHQWEWEGSSPLSLRPSLYNCVCPHCCLIYHSSTNWCISYEERCSCIDGLWVVGRCEDQPTSPARWRGIILGWHWPTYLNGGVRQDNGSGERDHEIRWLCNTITGINSYLGIQFAINFSFAVFLHIRMCPINRTCNNYRGYSQTLKGEGIKNWPVTSEGAE